MQLCEPSLRLDAQALDARISRVEEQLASGVLVKSAPKASGGDAFDDDRPPFPDDADDPERGSAPPAQTQEQSSAAPQAETPAGFWPALSEKLRASLPDRIGSFFIVDGPIHPILQADALIMAADTDFVMDLVKKRAEYRLVDPGKSVGATGQAGFGALCTQKPAFTAGETTRWTRLFSLDSSTATFLRSNNLFTIEGEQTWQRRISRRDADGRHESDADDEAGPEDARKTS